jgi:hypothetical protein
MSEQTPNGLTQKELLLEVRKDVKAVKTTVDILASQNLDKRVEVCEEWQIKTTSHMGVISRGVKILTGIAAAIAGAVGIGFLGV